MILGAVLGIVKDAHKILGLAVKIMWIEVDGASVFALFMSTTG